MNLILDGYDEIYERLEKPSANPVGLSLAMAVRQMRQTQQGGFEIDEGSLEGMENRVLASVRGLPASLPDPMHRASMQFIRDGERYIGQLLLTFGVLVPNDFSDFLSERFSLEGGSDYVWDATKSRGIGYFNNFGKEDNNPVVSIDGMDGGRESVRMICLGNAGASSRVFSPEEFRVGFTHLRNITNKYINAFLDYASEVGFKPSGRFGWLRRRKKYDISESESSIVRLSAQ
jgi:hypothetical protein